MADCSFSRSFLGKVERILSTLTLAHSTSLAMSCLETPDSVFLFVCLASTYSYVNERTRAFMTPSNHLPLFHFHLHFHIYTYISTYIPSHRCSPCVHFLRHHGYGAKGPTGIPIVVGHPDP